MPAIFISHSSTDRDAAAQICAELDRLNFEKVFLDFDPARGIPLGENWEKTLYENIARCHAMILVLTPDWLTSTWCQVEFRQARALGKLILPIVCSPLESARVLPEIQAADFMDWGSGGALRLERSLLSINEELARGFSLPARRPPYPGIYAFEADDAAIYFGRDDEVRGIIEKLNARRTLGGSRLLLIIGASGSGKSSLLKAGVLPQIARMRHEWLALAPMRPEKAPLEALAKGIAERLGDPTAWRTWHENLKTPEGLRRLEDAVKDWRVGDSRHATVLLPFDQLEEVFTIAEAGERADFLRALAAILDPARGWPVVAVATGRADVLQGLLEKSELAQLLETTPLVPMPLERVPQLVRGPAGVASISVEDGLAEQIMRDVESPDALPLLAYMLEKLYQLGRAERRFTLAAYRSLGDPARHLNPVQNAVRLGADQAITLTPPATAEELAALRDAFAPHLVRVRLDDGRRVRRPSLLSDLPRAAERLVNALVAARLLTVRMQDGKAIVEVAHEALFAAWPTLAEWLDEEHAFLSDVERLKDAHETWKQAPVAHKPQALLSGLLLARARDWLLKHPTRFAGSEGEALRAFVIESAGASDAEHARARRLRQRVFQAAVIAALTFFSGFVVATWQYYEAAQQKREAERQRTFAEEQSRIARASEAEAQRQQKEAEKQRAEAERQRSEAERERAAAEEARKTAETAEARAVAESERAQRNFSIAKVAADEVVTTLAQSMRYQQGIQGESLQAILDSARRLIDQLAEAAPDDMELQRSRVAMLDEFAKTYVYQGEMTRAVPAHEETLKLMREIVAKSPDSDNLKNDLSTILFNVAETRFTARDYAGAKAAIMECVALQRELLAKQPDNVDRIMTLVWTLRKIGDNIYDAEHDGKAALASFDEALGLLRKIETIDPRNENAPVRRAEIVMTIGDIRRDAGQTAEALAAYEESLTLRRAVAQSHPQNILNVRDVSVSLDRIGGLHRDAGNRPLALNAFEESLTIMRKIASADPGNAEWQADLVRSIYHLSRVTDAARSRALLTEALPIAEKLAREERVTERNNFLKEIRNALAKLPAR